MELEKAFGNQDARAAWNEGARAWEEFVESGADYDRHEVHGPALLAVCEPVAGLDVLDLGCGQGFFSRQLAKRGARVVAIDIAEELLALARKHEEQEPLGITYHNMNAGQVNQHWQEGSFDWVTACMALHDMADTEAILRSVSPSVRRGCKVRSRSSNQEGGWPFPCPIRVPILLFASGSETSQAKKGP